MMLDKRLIATIDNGKKYILLTILMKWMVLIMNIIFSIATAALIQKAYLHEMMTKDIFVTFIILISTILIRYFCNIKTSSFEYGISQNVKHKLRHLIYEKILSLGMGYKQKVSTSHIVQISGEGIEQLEMYCGKYLPQLFYSILAPLTLFVVLIFINIKVALILLFSIPLLPLSLIAVNKFANKLFSKYWNQYISMGDSFLDNLQGLTTLKIYGDDQYKNEQMNQEAETFRKITMKVLKMQLNSVTVMDLIAYGGTALGIFFALLEFRAGSISISDVLIFILLASDFFIPLRLLGSFFHISMNGMAASKKIFSLLDERVCSKQLEDVDFNHYNIQIHNLFFFFFYKKKVLKRINMKIKEKTLTALVGESGCGKSTLASLLMGLNKGYEGSIQIGGKELSHINETSIMKNVCIVKHENYLFKGTVRNNLLMAKPNATAEEMYEVLKRVNLYDFVINRGGLEFQLEENAHNISGGQAQRLALARALLHECQIYIFDEATSNIDVESETIINQVIQELSKQKTVIIITHRLANVVCSHRIYVLLKGEIVEQGTHSELIHHGKVYKAMYEKQKQLESLYKGGLSYA
ncbi:MAG: ABC transporter ATP-binding protein/permease [Clostridia bacterium]|nr:ABC transporter ATP-binding protein/permease [Clostridia bacterium]